MLIRPKLLLCGNRGFTLIELLVVMLIIGILASLALPAFLHQRTKGEDAAAKSDARNMVSLMEACFTEEDQYTGCGAQLMAENTGLSIGSGPGQVQTTAESSTGFTVVATSRAATGASQHTFTIVRDLPANTAHDCAVRGQGGCPADGNW
jgi:type IV pilus assembly protein PilA